MKKIFLHKKGVTAKNLFPLFLLLARFISDIRSAM